MPDVDNNKTPTPTPGDGNPTPPTATPAPADPFVVPDGFDADMFDDNHVLKTDAVKAKFDELNAAAGNYKKQAEDMRRKMSNKDALQDEAEYAKGYTSDWVKNYAGKDDDAGKFLTATLGNVDKIAKENGLSLSQANAVKDGLYGLMKDLGVIDERTDEERSAAIAKLQSEVLGEKAAEIVKDNTEWIKGYGLFSDAEKDMLNLACTQGNPLINSVVHKFKVLFNRGSSADIPVRDGVNQDGLPPDSVLAEEYKTANQDRRTEIIQQRIAAGRKGNLPIPAK